jgi:SagB-type dehydrogenase family enzyme
MGRRSVREFGNTPLTLTDIATLLFLGAGVTAEVRHPSDATTRRAAPSAGGLHATEVYVVVRAVENLAPGTYHYRANEHALEVLRLDTAEANRLASASSYPEIVGAAAAILVLTAIFGRTAIKYGERGYRFTVLEVGHVAQNMLLVASGLGLGAVPVGGFIDDDVHQILDVDGVDEASFYLIPVGHLPPIWDRPGWMEGQEAIAAVTELLWSTRNDEERFLLGQSRMPTWPE